VPGLVGVGLPLARLTTGSLGTVKSGTEVVGSDGAVDVVVVDGHVVVVDDDVPVVEVPAGAGVRGAAAAPA